MWKTLVAAALSRSSAQRDGSPSSGRTCRPELKYDDFLRRPAGRNTMVRLAGDLDGRTVKRDVCTFNEYGGIRSCPNWDTSVTTREMKNSEGDRYGVE